MSETTVNQPATHDSAHEPTATGERADLLEALAKHRRCCPPRR
ncbi:hypothetical protein ACFY6U_33470 [Streptomyces sp. NPDC013157]